MQSRWNNLTGVTPQSNALLGLSNHALILHPTNRYRQGTTTRHAVNEIVISGYAGAGTVDISCILLVQHYTSDYQLIQTYAPETDIITYDGGILTIDGMVSSATDKFVVFVASDSRTMPAAVYSEYDIDAATDNDPQIITHNLGHLNYLVQARDNGNIVFDPEIVLGTHTVTINKAEAIVAGVGKLAILDLDTFRLFSLDATVDPDEDQVFDHNLGHSNYIIQLRDSNNAIMGSGLTAGDDDITVDLSIAESGTAIVGLSAEYRTFDLAALDTEQAFKHFLGDSHYIVQVRDASGNVMDCEIDLNTADEVNITLAVAETGTVTLLTGAG